MYNSLPPLSIGISSRVELYLRLAKQVKTNDSIVVLHDFRVASRRLMAIEPIIAKAGKTTKWKRQTRRWARSLNQLRDLQVLQSRFATESQISQKISSQISLEQYYWQQKKHTVADSAYCLALNKLQDKFNLMIINTPQLTTIILYEYWFNAFALVKDRLHAINPLQLSSLHCLRVKFKLLRYLLELLLESEFVDGINIEQYRNWQDKLGELSDIDFAVRWLQQHWLHGEQLRQLQQHAQQLSHQFVANIVHFEQCIDETNDRVILSLKNTM